MADLRSRPIHKGQFVTSLDGHYDHVMRAFWVHMDYKDLMTVAGFRHVLVRDDIHGGQKPAMGGVGYYWL